MAQPSPSGLNARDQHYFGPGQKRMLCLDGGGVRGVITVAFLKRIKQLLSDRYGSDVRLGDWFDLVGGTSTGSIIAGALALGYRADDLEKFYVELAPRVFRSPFWRIMFWHAKFDAAALFREIVSVAGNRTLDSIDLITGLCVVAKRMDTGSAWIVSNNPRAPYWNTPENRAFIGNRHYKLANLIRSSTAAPFYFDPELLPVIDGELEGLFIDGAISPHNNPSLAMFLMTTLKGHGICWPTGPDNLLICSIGTGNFRTSLSASQARRSRALGLAVRSLGTLVGDSSDLILTLMQWLGESPTAWWLNSEIGNLQYDTPSGGPMFRFLRYDAVLEAKWLDETLDLKLSDSEIRRIRLIDDPGIIPLAFEIGKRAAERQVKIEHFGLKECV